jgi:hypothetical protein
VINREEAMIKINRCSSLLRPLLLATAVPVGLLAAGAMSAHAGAVTVTGANGANATPYHLPGAGGSATATTTTPSDASNTATATGGNGGSDCYLGARDGCGPHPGGRGGAADATATTSISSGAASAEATSFGGAGGEGAEGVLALSGLGPGGDGGAATSSAAASSTTGSASATASSTGGAGGRPHGGPAHGCPGGTASSSAAASSTTGSPSATASSTSASGATASANAQNSDGAAVTSASAPAGSALTNATVGSGSPTLVNITAGQAVSNAILTPNGPDIGVGAMSAAYGGVSEEYSATAVFDFSASPGEALDLNLLSDNVSGIGFNSLELQVTLGDGTPQTYNFSSPTGTAGAETFFAANALPLGAIVEGGQTSVSLSYDLTFSAGTLAKVGDGFGFAYDIADPPLTGSAPEASTWAMMALGFAGLGLSGYRARRAATSIA